MTLDLETFTIKDGVTPLNAEELNPRFYAIVRRLHALEQLKINWEQVVSETTTYGLTRINEAVKPLVDGLAAEMQALLDEGQAVIDAVGVHADRTDNPHGTTAALVPYDNAITALEAATIQEAVDALVNQLLAHAAQLYAHRTSTSNPHGVTAAQSGGLAKSANLGDVLNATTALTNLGGLAKSANLGDVQDAVGALLNLGGRPHMHVQDRRAEGVHYGRLYANQWTTRALNTVVSNTIQGATLDGDLINLPDAGTYLLIGSAPAAQVNGHRSAVDSALDSTLYITGTTENAPDGSGGFITRSWLIGSLTTTGAESLRVKTGVTFSKDWVGEGGVASGGFGPEIYTDIHIWRIA